MPIASVRISCFANEVFERTPGSQGCSASTTTPLFSALEEARSEKCPLESATA